MASLFLAGSTRGGATHFESHNVKNLKSFSDLEIRRDGDEVNGQSLRVRRLD